MGEKLIAAMDQGGHASRVLIFDEGGDVVARGLREVSETRPRRDWVEQDPEEIVASIRGALDEALGFLGGSGRGLHAGLATQRSSLVCWNRATGKALSPVISWQDRRAGDWLAGLALDDDWVHERTGLYPTAHYGASKLRWSLDHLPAVAAARDRGEACCGPLASFLVFRLLEERPFAVDPANAARTLLWNRRTFDWDGELLARFGIPRDVLPSCRPTRHDYGTLRAKGATLSLEMVNGDQSAAVFGGGPLRDETAYVNLGTGAFVQRVARQDPGSPPGLLTSVVLQDADRVVWVIEGTVNGAGSALQRVADDGGLADYRPHLEQWLETVTDPPLFLNGVSGLGSPWWVPGFRSRFIGDGDPREKMVAAAESVVFLLRVNLSLLASRAPGLDRIAVSGGLGGYDGICQRLADLTGLAVERSEEHEATSRGLAFLLAGSPEGWPEPGLSARFAPRENPGLATRFNRWRDELDSALAVQGD
jgi:glycerol kinase